MKATYEFAICVGFWMGFSTQFARANEGCDSAYRGLKQYEEQHQVNSEAALEALRKGGHCSELVLKFEDQVDVNSRSIAVLARTFVIACHDDPSKADELAYYGLDAVLNPRPSTLRRRCESGK